MDLDRRRTEDSKDGLTQQPPRPATFPVYDFAGPTKPSLCASIRPTGFGTYGIHWKAQGEYVFSLTYSGPFRTSEEAEQRAREIANRYGRDVVVETLER
jgi:hypothetical protein